MSIPAGHGMARGWTDFWVMWLMVDAVGVPLLDVHEYYPSAVMYLVYGGFVVWGFLLWRRAARTAEAEISVREPTAAAAT